MGPGNYPVPIYIYIIYMHCFADHISRYILHGKLVWHGQISRLIESSSILKPFATMIGPVSHVAGNYGLWAIVFDWGDQTSRFLLASISYFHTETPVCVAHVHMYTMF